MSDLEQLIKEIEFDNENVVRQIEEEMKYIEAIQKELQKKVKANKKLEENFTLKETDVRFLEEQYKQNVSTIDSLKSSSSAQHVQESNLRSKLKIAREETEKNREKLEGILVTYSEKWLQYQSEYEKHPTAQRIRKLKLKFADLDAEETALVKQRKELEEKVEEILLAKEFKKNMKKNAIAAIVKIAETMKKSTELALKIPQLQEQEAKLQERLTELFLKMKVRENQKKSVKEEELRQPPWVLYEERKQEQNASSTSQPRKQYSFPKLPSFSMPRLPTINRNSFPKMPKLPNFPSVGNNSPKMFNLPKKGLQSPGIPSSLSPVKESDIMPAQTEEKSSLPIGNFVAPLDQSTDEYFSSHYAMDVDKPVRTYRPPTPQAKFNFSPKQHALELKKLKQSPENSFQLAGRPMFNQSKCVETAGIEDVNESEFMSTFNSGSQFMGGTLQKQANVNQMKSVNSPVTSPLNTHTKEAAHAPKNDAEMIDFTTSSHIASEELAFPAQQSGGSSFVFSTGNSPAAERNDFKDSESQFSFDTPNREVAQKMDTNEPAVFNFASPAADSKPFNFGIASPGDSGGVFTFNGPPAGSSVFSFGGDDATVPASEGFDFTFGGETTKIPKTPSGFSFNF